MKYAKLIDKETGRCEVGIGDPDAVFAIEEQRTLYVRDFYESLGMSLLDVEKGHDGNWYLSGRVPDPVYTVADYDKAMEEYIFQIRAERGYTTREPSEYKDSSVPKWRQDALDYIAFRDEVMLYGLQIQNDYAAGKPVPTLEEFKAGLPVCVWSYAEV